MLTLNLDRDDWSDVRVLGSIRDATSEAVIVPDTLELPWLDNAKSKSCIPVGTYLCEKRYSPAHKMNLWWVTGVIGRDDIEIHWGNFPSNSLGCILVGQSREADAIDNSKLAFNAFMAATADVSQFTLVVRDVRAGSSIGGAQ